MNEKIVFGEKCNGCGNPKYDCNCPDKPKYSAEDIVSLIISNTASQYSEEWKPDIVYTKEELIKIVQSYAKQ